MAGALIFDEFDIDVVAIADRGLDRPEVVPPVRTVWRLS